MHRRPKSRKVQIAIRVAFPVGVLLLILPIWFDFKHVKRRLKRANFVEKYDDLSPETEEKIKIFKKEELMAATDNFNITNRLAKGGHGTVYKGTLKNGINVAIKKTAQDKWFITEVGLLSRTTHKNIVKLLGCCLETDALMLVYEYAVNGDLARHLRNGTDAGHALSWDTRLKIAAGTAEALAYMHHDAGAPFFHRDVKPENILLDDEYTAKLADFGISQPAASNESEVRGSDGYKDPEYIESKRYTDKSDVFSFGVVLAELLTGKRALSVDPAWTPEMGDEVDNDHVIVLSDHFMGMEMGSIMDTLLDVRVKRQGSKSDVEAVVKLAKRCLAREGRKRPNMKDVALELGKIRAAQMNAFAEVIEWDYNQPVKDICNPRGGVSQRSDSSL